MGKLQTLIFILLWLGALSLVRYAFPYFLSKPATSFAGNRAGPEFSREPVRGTTMTYYVSPEGDDSNPGTEEEPWASPGYGSRQLGPGDTLVILGGTYEVSIFDDDIITPPSGNRLTWTSVRGEEGNRPVLAGSNNLMVAVDLSGKNYVRIENLEITSDEGEPFRDGISALGGQAKHIILKDISIHHIDEFGINMGDVTDLRITGSDITYCGFGSVGGPAGVEGGWRNVRINDCNLSYAGHYYQGGPGPGPYDRPDGFGIEPSSGPIEISYTMAEHNMGDGLDSKAENTYIHECEVANNSCDGIKLWGSGSRVENVLVYGRGDGSTEPTPWAALVIGTDDPGSSFEIINASIDDSLGNNYLMYVQYDNPTVPVNLTIVNTIFSARGNNSQIYLADAVNFIMGHNLFYFPYSAVVLQHGDIRSYYPSEVDQLGPGNIYGDPLFVSPGLGREGDYHLENGSPAIDAGISILAPPADLDGTPRPQGDEYDIGCYER